MTWGRVGPKGWGSNKDDAGDLQGGITQIIRTVLEVVAGGVLRAVKRAYSDDTNAGWWLGVDTDGDAKLNIGDGDQFLKWTGEQLSVRGDLELEAILGKYDGGGVVCSEINDRTTCDAEPTCAWAGGNGPNGRCEESVACTQTEDPEVTCTDGIDNDCNGATDCNDASCSGDPACQTACDNDGVCDPGEDCLSCANDCAGVTGGRPANRYCCGNGIEEGPEGDGAICDGNF